MLEELMAGIGRDRELMLRQNPVIVQGEGLLVAGLRYGGSLAPGGIFELWHEEFIPRLAELVAPGTGDVKAWGVIRPDPGAPPEDAFEYLAGVQVDSAEDLPLGMVAWEIPAGLWAAYWAGDLLDLSPILGLHLRLAPMLLDYEPLDGPYYHSYLRPPDTFPQMSVFAPLRRRE